MNVSLVGQMRAVMREGHTEARIALVDLTCEPHAFAVGAMAGLDGEVTVIDGEVWITRVAKGRPVTFGPHAAPADRATLLVSSHVSAWRSMTLPAAAAGEALEAMIEHSARENGLDTSRPFPFQIEGELSALDLHVINGYCPHSGGDASDANKPWTFTTTARTPAKIVGFFAKNSEGVMTHHDTTIHAHAIIRLGEGPLTGHVDSFAVHAGVTLVLPTAPQ